MENICKRLKELREDNDLSQQQLADILGMHKTTYARYEQGLRKIPFQLIIRISEFYGVSTDYIGGLIDNPKPRDEK